MAIPLISSALRIARKTFTKQPTTATTATKKPATNLNPGERVKSAAERRGEQRSKLLKEQGIPRHRVEDKIKREKKGRFTVIPSNRAENTSFEREGRRKGSYKQEIEPTRREKLKENIKRIEQRLEEPAIKTKKNTPPRRIEATGKKQYISKKSQFYYDEAGLRQKRPRKPAPTLRVLENRANRRIEKTAKKTAQAFINSRAVNAPKMLGLAVREEIALLKETAVEKEQRDKRIASEQEEYINRNIAQASQGGESRIEVDRAEELEQEQERLNEIARDKEARELAAYKEKMKDQRRDHENALARRMEYMRANNRIENSETYNRLRWKIEDGLLLTEEERKKWLYYKENLEAITEEIDRITERNFELSSPQAFVDSIIKG